MLWDGVEHMAILLDKARKDKVLNEDNLRRYNFIDIERRKLYNRISVDGEGLLFSVTSLLAQGKPLGRVTAVTEDKRHSVTGILIQYTDAYGKTYLELEIGEKKSMAVKELKYTPYDYQYYVNGWGRAISSS